MANESKPKRFPVVMTIVTVAVAATLIVARRMDLSMADSFLHHDFAIVNIATMLAIALLVVGWMIWLKSYSGWPKLYSRAIPLLLVGGCIVFLVFFRPRIDGSLAVRRWEPRFGGSRTVKMTGEKATIDLGDGTALDFPQFLGANRNGRIKNSNIHFKNLAGQAEVVWKQPIGQAWSGFVASNGFAFTMAQELGEELVVCYEIKTGDTKWIYRHARRHDDPLGGVGPRSTPTIDNGKIYALGVNGLLVCLDATNGEVRWKVDISKLLGIELVERDTPNGAKQYEQITAIFGRSASPLIYEDKVIVPGGGMETGRQVSLIAFNKETGEEIWRGGQQSIGYASPTVVNIHGDDQILITNEASVAGHDPQTGRELWNHPWPGRSDRDANTSQPTDAGDNRVLITKGYGGGAELFEIIKDEQGVFSTESIWQNQRVLKTKMTSPVVKGQFAYGLSDRFLECVDLTSGDRVWKNGRYGHGQLLLVDDHLLIHGEKGFLALVPATPDEYKELGRIETIRGICRNTLCIYDQFVLVRSDLEAACLRISSSKSH